jgi:hypothetical protein
MSHIQLIYKLENFKKELSLESEYSNDIIIEKFIKYIHDTLGGFDIIENIDKSKIYQNVQNESDGSDGSDVVLPDESDESDKSYSLVINQLYEHMLLIKFKNSVDSKSNPYIFINFNLSKNNSYDTFIKNEHQIEFYYDKTTFLEHKSFNPIFVNLINEIS